MDEDSVVMRFKMEGEVDKKQIKQEMDSAQKIADSNEVQIPTKTKKVNPKDIKEEVESVQKVADKTSVEIPVKLTQKDIEEELNKLIKQKGKSQKEVRAKLDDIMKDMDLSDTIKESIKTLFIKYRSMANSTKGFSSASKNSKDEFVKLAEKFSKVTGSKKSTSMVKVMSGLTATQAQKYRNEGKTKTQLKQDKQKLIDDVTTERTKQDASRENLQKARIKEQRATRLVEGSGDGKPSLADNLISEMSKYMESLTYIRSHYTSEDGTLPKGNQRSADELEKQLSSVSQRLDAIRTEYANKDTFVPEAEAELEKITKNLEAVEAEAAKRLEEINKTLGPVEKLLVDPSNLTPKHYSDMFKESLPQQKFKLRTRRTLTDDVADAAINREELKKLRRGASRGEANAFGSDTKLGLRQSYMSGPYVDKKRIIRTAIGGPYADTNSYVRNAMETQKASYKLAKKTLEKFIVELNKLQEFIDKRNAEINAKAEAEGRMGIAGKGRNKNEVTKQEQNTHLSQITTELAGKEAKKISKGDPKADVKVFEESLKASFGYLTESLGPSIWKPLEQNVNRIMANFAGGTFKITDDPIKGEGENYAELAKLLKENFKNLNEFFEQNEEMAILAELSRRLKTAANISVDTANEVLKEFDGFLRKFGYNPGRTPAPTKGTTTQKRNESPLTGNTLLSRDVKETNKQLEKSITFTKIGNVVQEENAETNKMNANTGTDSEAGKNEVVEATEKVDTTIEKTFDGGNGGNGGNNIGGGDLGDTGPSILEQIRDILMSINAYTTAIFDLLPKLKLTIKREKRSEKKNETSEDTSMYPVVAGELKDRTEEAFQAIRNDGKTILQDNTDPAKLRQQQAISDIERARAEAIEKNKQAKYSSIELSQDVSTTTKTIGDILKKAFGVTTATTEVDRIKNLNQAQREKELAELTKTYGIADRDRNVTSTGDKGRAFRMKSVYGYNQKNINPFKDLKLTPGLEIDVKGITDSLQTMIEKNMFSAQTGVRGLGDVIKLSLGGIGMPSLEKSRAQVDAANEILSIIHQAILELLQAIQANETTLRGFEASGDAKFDDNGIMVSGSNEAWATFGQLEEQKSALNGLIAELTKMDQLSAKTGGNMTKFFKLLGFISPELRKCNIIVSNINSGLNKNGKALKFQKRIQETLNYSFQLLTRHIGQMIKGWLMMLNPINLIKKAFSDFTSYNTKWQRTMNVVKYNLRSIILPIMDKIAQLLVNMLGVVDIILQKVQSAFGRNPISLFDQENAQKFKEEVEQINSISAGFDELHDIGQDDDKSADNLMGDIYKPQLSKEWQTFAEKLGDIFSGIAKAIKWCIDNWKLFVALLAGFVIAKGLWNLLNLALGLGNAFGGLANIPWGSIAKGLGWVAAAATTAMAIYETGKLGFKWDQMYDKEKNKTMGKSIGFGTLAGGIIGTLIAPGVGTAIGAGIGAAITGGIDSAIADYNGDDARAEIAGAIGGAGIGATIGTLISPGIGTAIGAAIGAGVGWGVEKLGHLTFSNGGDYSNLKISTEDLAWANEQLATAQDNVYKSLYNLKSMEEQTGESGKALYDAVQNGTLSFDNMSAAQIAVYDAYKSHVGVLDELKAAQQTQMDYETSMDLDRAEKSDNYTDYINKMIEANNNGIYSNEELQDRFAQVYGELDRNSRQVFLEQLPENMRQSVELQGQNYLSNWSKFYDSCCTNWENFKTRWGEFWTGVGETFSTKWEELKTGAATTWENMKTTAGNIWEGMKTIAGNVWNSIKIEAGEAWEGIKNSAVGQKVQEMATNVATKWDEIKTKAGETWNNIKATASQKWEEIKNSAIGQKVQDIWKNVTNKFNDIKTSLSNSWNSLTGAASTAWENIKSSIVNAAKNAWEGAKGFFDKIGEGIKNAWEGLKKLGEETGQKIGNFFSGNGWKTDAEVSSRSVPSMSVGTNYVPNDGLVYLHQGEAVIPKKYNQPYQPGTLSPEERAYMTQMMSTMRSLDNTMKQGINVNGQFVQRGSDLVAVVNKTKSQTGADVLSNVAYAR